MGRTVLLVVWVAGQAFAQDALSIGLGVGTQRVLNVPGLQRIAIGDPAVADAKPLGTNQILVTGQSEGRTTLMVWKAGGHVTYQISVRKQDPNELTGEIRKLLGDIAGVSLRQGGDRIYLDGQVYTAQDGDRIEQITALYPNVKSFVKVAPNTKKVAAQNLNAAFQRAGLTTVIANVVGSTVFLEGSVESQQDLTKAELITKAMGEKVENLLTIGIKRMILSEVQFVEIRESARDRMGIKYPTELTGAANGATSLSRSLPGFGGALNGGVWSLGGNLTAQMGLSFNASDGNGRLLAQPRLVCASGEKAEFLAGGEIPIPLITNNQFTVEYKQYGIILRLRPTADRRGNIQTDIEAEVSEVDNTVQVTAGGASNVPGFRTRKVKTSVTVRHGETIVLSGVFSADDQKSVSKLPGLGNIPIIGELFKNRSFDNEKRELVIFVTPRIVNPDAPRIHELIDDVKARYNQARGEVQFNLFD
ncbi:MAG: type II and III secretion system protein family protein [Myxococcaceae bacterium]